MKVTYIDHMGTDLSVVNAARVSFGKASDWDYSSCPDPDGMPPEIVNEYRQLSKSDKSLINFLARGCTSGDWEQLLCDMGGSADKQFEDCAKHIRRMPTHWTPFAHTSVTLHFKVPLFVTRQLDKHQVGFVVNEVSRRYVSDEPDIYVPDVWRKRADNVKQGSSDEAVDISKEYVWCDDNVPKYGWDDYTLEELYNEHLERESLLYKKMLERGICPEQARMVLPQSMYTEFYKTGSLYGWANLYNQRSDSHAQKEVQMVAAQIRSIVEVLYPESWKALTQ